MKNLITSEKIINKIFFIRSKKVMFDKYLARLYGVETKILKQQVKRNMGRFPKDFMFELTEAEFKNWKARILNQDLSLRSQIVTSKRGGSRYLPYVFTEQGVAMLSSVLKNKKAIQVNIQIIRTFTKLREILLTHKELRKKIEKIETEYDQKFKTIFQVIKKLIQEKPLPLNKEIGFKIKK
jgi:hypothetical protein